MAGVPAGPLAGRPPWRGWSFFARQSQLDEAPRDCRDTHAQPAALREEIDKLQKRRVRLLRHQHAELCLLRLRQEPLPPRWRSRPKMAQGVASYPHLAHPAIADTQNFSGLPAACSLIQKGDRALTQIDGVRPDH